MDERYSRQILFNKIGESGQKKLAEKHILIIGAGALGTGNAEQLVRAGVGKITIVDRDYVESSNLQRQQLYTEKDAETRMPKAAAAKERLQQINSSVQVEAHVADVQVNELRGLMEGVQLIIDATDNFDTRLLINDMSQKHEVPWIYGACVGSYGLSYTIIPGKSPCLKCLLESVPMGGATCDTAGIISPAVQMVTAYQSVEALKILVEDYDALRHKLVSFDLWSNRHIELDISNVKKEQCPSCGTNPSYPHLSFENQTKSAVLCGRATVQIRPSARVQRDLEQLEKALENQAGKVERNPFLLSYQFEDKRLIFFKDGRVMIHGTKDIAEAKTLYHKIVG
ncbi:thiazole biosynthesis adenylyltransferase ThiF [Falsibacillus albus]|uniref:Thiazole biosynthesis adenylyltransferase ThiF n=1 Tax=Falsibacillus albus TaxID=2478915 RepID=A0A3L7JSL4_9BACI|nr:thiazole biosynthesis adenylyltransferase ThiF [Falsibacillus albus]RLQ93255.1 thiazole biosynthesis adenylyltransferase ThiF [Falsibacillus albus]